MMTYLKNLLLLTIVLLVVTSDGLSQAGNTAAYTQIGISPRTIAIGNAYTAGGAEGVFSYYNPAQAASVQYNQFDFSGASMSFNRRLAGLQATFPLPPSAGVVFDIQYAGVTGFDGRTQSGYHTEMFETHDMQFGATFGLQLNERLSLGTRITYRTSSYTLNGVDTPSSIGIDVGLRYLLSSTTAIGFAAQDMIGEFVWDTSDFYGSAGSLQTTDKTPVRIKAGIWHQLTDYKVNLYAEFENRFITAEQLNQTTSYNGVRPVLQLRRNRINYTRQFARLGASAPLHERITARAGWQSGETNDIYNTQRFSAGFSLSLPFDMYAPEIDYAVLREPGGVTWMHMFAIRLTFNN